MPCGEVRLRGWVRRVLLTPLGSIYVEMTIGASCTPSMRIARWLIPLPVYLTASVVRALTRRLWVSLGMMVHLYYYLQLSASSVLFLYVPLPILC